MTFVQTVITTIALFFCVHSYAQNALLGDINLATNSYTLYGLISAGESHAIQQEWGAFKISDQKVLQQLQKEWDVPYYTSFPCRFSHYKLILARNNSIVKTFHLNLDCESLKDGDQTYYFPLSKLSQFKSSCILLEEAHYTTNNLHSARRLFDFAAQHPEAFIPDLFRYNWLNFDGSFTIERIDSVDALTTRRGIYQDETQVSIDMKKELLKAYPSNTEIHIECIKVENFNKVTEEALLNITQYQFKVYCNQDFFQGFNQYRILKTWQPFQRFYLDIYGIPQVELDALIRKQDIQGLEPIRVRY